MEDEAERKLENRSTKEILLELLDEFERCSGEFFEDVSKVATQYVPPKQPNELFHSKALEGLIEKHNQLQDVAQKAQDQQSRHVEITKAKEELGKKNQEILQLHSLLNETEQLLSNALFQARKKFTAIQTATKNKITSEELIKYAHRISSSCAVEAPSNWTPGDPRRPYPLDIEMRSGLLGKMQERHVPGSQPMEQNITTNPTSSELDRASPSLPQNGEQDVSDVGGTTWRSALNSAQSETNTVGQSSFLDTGMHIDISNGLMGTTRDELEQMSTSSSSTSSDSP
ncbi:mediator of RNA polymerase II transcription subunit 4-like [Dendronephthya gigantea]|uniref:mediator of RNA polymerase II transcription subunit 4-like n=1 Tax=Dendronephthya gigantea TaxID=151771 RepID=UPI00106A1D47|nr:mediator of RNA polymerase II transcription subunit 4-like [Dendronephthya gigantea]